MEGLGLHLDLGFSVLELEVLNLQLGVGGRGSGLAG